MFYDERIESVKGHISRNAIILSILISFIIGGIRIFNVLINTNDLKYLCLVSLEILICLLGVAILFFGFIRKYKKDERVINEKKIYYNKASIVLVKITTFVFAIFLPIILYMGIPNGFSDTIFGNILFILFFLIGIYVIFSFKRNDIFFNYSIIDNDNYYKCILKNICKFALFIFYLFMTSLFVYILCSLKYNFNIYFLILIISMYTGILVFLSSLYLLYSFLEKTSYNSDIAVSKATLILLGTVILTFVTYTFLMIYINSLNLTTARVIQIITYISEFFKPFIVFVLLLFLIYFSYEYLKAEKNKMLFIGCILILLVGVLYYFNNQILGCITSLLIKQFVENNFFVIYILSYIRTIILYLFLGINIVGISLLIISLIKDKIIKKVNILSIIFMSIAIIVQIFLRTQAEEIMVSIYSAVCESFVLIYLYIIAIFINRKNIKYIEE
ncbi:MAG: hypothetical protein ACI35S_10305 [Anaeroplasma sp.]